MNKNPLVSVVVVTYNSSSTILDTLDSIASQHYNNVELIISDDCSKDETVKTVNLWLEKHKDLFVNSKIITTRKNSGTVKNLNRGIKASKGEWIKILAGDDCLNKNAIESYVQYVNNHQDCKMCISHVELFSNDGVVDQKSLDEYDLLFDSSNVPHSKQLRRIKYSLTFVGPTYFFSRELYNEVSGFDEKYVLLEEWPFCYNVLKRGYHIHAINEKLVRYRIANNSVSHKRNNGLRGYQIYKDTFNFFFKVRLLELLKDGRFIRSWNEIIKYVKERMLQEHRGSSLWMLLSKSLSIVYPTWYKNQIRSICNIIKQNNGKV